MAVYDVNDHCKNAWMLLMDLKIDKAKELLAKEVSQNPENYYAYYLDQTCDAYKMLINSNENDYDAFVEHYEQKREIMDDKDIDSPYYLACYSEMQMQLGMFNIIYGSQYSGVMKMYSAYKKVYRNLDKYPEFNASLMLDGFFNVAMSTLPPFVKWVVSFFGVSSDVEYGFKILKKNYQSQKYIKGINANAALFVILAAKINKTPERVYNFTKTLDSSISHTFIHQYFKANIAYRTGRNEEALATMQQITIHDQVYADIIYNYLTGKILLQKQDELAGEYISNYLKQLKKKEYVKEMNYKLAIFYIINNKPTAYQKYCKIVRNKGNVLNERDREALYDANLDYIPNVNLVKARLSLDGGYLSLFQTFLNEYEKNPDGVLAHQLEYLFLKARFNAEELRTKDAISEFKKVIELGDDEDYYFASEAALRLGDIYRAEGDQELAKVYYKKSIKLYKSNYYEYIEDKASKALKNL